jgi:type II secretory pathway component GspD/PulD (secretin)
VRSTKSVIKVRDGETVIMGGLIHQDKQKVSTKVPIFSDIPILGMLFRHKQIPMNKDRELLVFITPHILKDEPAMPVKTTFNKRRASGNRVSQAQGGDKVTLFTRHEAVNTALNNLE